MVPITRRFLEGTDLCDETDLRRFDQISFGSSGARVDVAVEGRDIPGMEVAVKELVVCLSPIAIILNTFLDNKLQMFNPVFGAPVPETRSVKIEILCDSKRKSDDVIRLNLPEIWNIRITLVPSLSSLPSRYHNN